jgi:hypothetical protein
LSPAAQSSSCRSLFFLLLDVMVAARLQQLLRVYLLDKSASLHKHTLLSV